MKKVVFIILGSICTLVGIIGIFIPVLPTTPLLLLAAWLFVRSSDNLYNWLINHRILGIYIKSYVKYRGVDMKYKIFAISMVWITILFSTTLVNSVYLKILLIVIMLGVTLHISSLRTLTKEEVMDLEEFEKIEKEKSLDTLKDDYVEQKY